MIFYLIFLLIFVLLNFPANALWLVFQLNYVFWACFSNLLILGK